MVLATAIAHRTVKLWLATIAASSRIFAKTIPPVALELYSTNVARHLRSQIIAEPKVLLNGKGAAERRPLPTPCCDPRGYPTMSSSSVPFVSWMYFQTKKIEMNEQMAKNP